MERIIGNLTAREREVIMLVTEGLTNKGIARRLNLTEGTVKIHLHNIFAKLNGVTTRTALAALVLREGSAE
jgi:two-component system nitrate/nitrite response regulator NarL